MKTAKGNADATHRLEDLTVHEVSLVTAAANKREFLVVKADMRGKLLKGKESAEGIAVVVAELQKLDASTPEGLKALREKTAILNLLLKDGDEAPTPAAAEPPAAQTPPQEPAVTPPMEDVAKGAGLGALVVTKASNVVPTQQITAALETLAQVAKMHVTPSTATSNVAKDEQAATGEATKDPWAEFDRKSSL
jgi:hypothetical protein